MLGAITGDIIGSVYEWNNRPLLPFWNPMTMKVQ